MNKAHQLTLGTIYSDAERALLSFSHWIGSDGDCAGLEGYNCWDYFDAEGRYLGPDKGGIEPAFTVEDSMNEHPDEQVAEAARDPNAGVIPPWTWPGWLTCAVIAKDSDGDWIGYQLADVECDDSAGVWLTLGDYSTLSRIVDTSGFPQVPWDESLRVNPNHKA